MNTGLELMILVSGKTIVVCKDIFNGEGYFCCTYCNINFVFTYFGLRIEAQFV